MIRLAQIFQNVTDAWLVWPRARLVVGSAIRIGIARRRIWNIDGRNGRGRAGQVWAGIYGNRHGQSSLVDHVQHVSHHFVPTGRAV